MPHHLFRFRSGDSLSLRANRSSGRWRQQSSCHLRAVAPDNDLENDKKQRNYTYIRREEERKLNRQGEVQSTESRTEEVMMLGGSQVNRLIAKNDTPLSAKDNAKEEERIQKIIEKRENETEEQRKKRLREEEKDREEARQWVSGISEAFNFRLVGTENIEGRETYVVDAEPRPGFKPHLKYAN